MTKPTARPQKPATDSSASPAPIVFAGHGSPMHALGGNPFSDSWRAIGVQLKARWPRIHTVLCVSAHWQTRTDSWHVMADRQPPTIHDFGGFPEILYQQQYPASGHPALAESLLQHLDTTPAFAGRVQSSTGSWGLDHGAWAILQSLYPDADICAVPVSLNGGLPDSSTMQQHYELGKALAQWRADSGLQQEVLILGSGNTVHNFALMRLPPSHPMWQQARQFDDLTAHAIDTGDHRQLWQADTALLRNAHPTLEHYLPLLTCAGAAAAGSAVSPGNHAEPLTASHYTAGSYPEQGIPTGMRSIVWS